MISIRRQSTAQAKVPALRQRLADFCATGARLRSSARINFHEHAPGAFGLVREHEKKVGPPCVIDGLRKHSARESLNVQILNSNQPIVINQLSREFVLKVGALALNARVNALQQEDGFISTFRASFTARESPLSDSQLSLRGSIPAWVFDCRPVGQGRERTKTNVNTDGIRREGQRRRFALSHEHRKPATGLALNCESLNVTGKRASDLDSDLTNLRDAELRSGKALPNLAQCKTGIPSARPKSRIARLLTLAHASVECLKRKIRTAQYSFQCAGVNPSNVGPDLSDAFQLKILIEPANMLTVQLPRVAPFLKGCVIQLTAQCKLFIQNLLLSLGWIDAVTVRS